MDEEHYKTIVNGRLKRDDFIVDDGVDGYADNGMDDWGDDRELPSDDEVKPKGERGTAVLKLDAFIMWT